MIVGFRQKGLEDLCLTGRTRRIGAGSIRRCVRVLQMLEFAEFPEDLQIPGMGLHKLLGDPPRWSVRITANYRITFGWSGKDAVDVDFEDYH